MAVEVRNIMLPGKLKNSFGGDYLFKYKIMETNTTPLKITKTNLNKVISWTTTRYNDWLGFGTKKEAVEKIFKALKEGNYKGANTFLVECASPVGETSSKGANGHYRSKNWPTKQCGGKYLINCSEKTITEQIRQLTIQFI